MIRQETDRLPWYAKPLLLVGVALSFLILIAVAVGLVFGYLNLIGVL